MHKKRSPEEVVPTELTVTLRAHIVRDLETMEKNTKRSIDDLVQTALLMFIATHNDFLGLRKSG